MQRLHLTLTPGGAVVYALSSPSKVILLAPQLSPPDKRRLELCPTSHCSQLNVSLKSGARLASLASAFFSLSQSPRSRFFAAVLAGNYWDLPCDIGTSVCSHGLNGARQDVSMIQQTSVHGGEYLVVDFYPWFARVSSPPVYHPHPFPKLLPA